MKTKTNAASPGLAGDANRSRSAMVPILLIALAVVIGFTMAACGGGGGSPTASTKAFLAALEKNDTKGMEKVATKGTMELMGMLGEKAATAFKEYGKVTGTAEKIDGDKATVSVTFANGETEDITLVKQDGKWLVDADVKK